MSKPTREQRLYDALKRITQYDSASKIAKTAERRYGLSGYEALEMAYENMQAMAKAAIRGMERPHTPEEAP